MRFQKLFFFLIESYANGSQPSTNASSTKVSTSSGGHFIYTLPGEVLKTSLNRHQRGMMDSKIYQLLTKKSIVLPQVRILTLFLPPPYLFLAQWEVTRNVYYPNCRKERPSRNSLLLPIFLFTLGKSLKSAKRGKYVEENWTHTSHSNVKQS